MSDPVVPGLELPIVRVTAYEDRAEVVREGEVELAGGSETLLIEGLTALISQDRIVATLHASGEATVDEAPVDEATVDDVRVEHRWIEVQNETILRLEDLDERSRAAQKEVRAADGAVARLVAQSQRLTAMAERYGAELGSVLARGLPAETATWEKGLTSFEESTSPLGAELEKARARADEARHEAGKLTELVVRAEARDTRYVCDVQVTVSGPPGRARLTLATVVPCGLWRPSHEAHLTEGSGGEHRVDWSTHATVWQQTGEDWNDVELILSTARPSAGAELPSLESDVLRLREKTKEEKKKIRVEHRYEEVPRADLSGAAPGVYDGGEARELRPLGRVTIASDGRPHRVAVGTFRSEARVEKVAMPELSPHVFQRATLHNRGGSPLLAGPVTLLSSGGWVGIADLYYVADGEEFDLSFGSDDRFQVTLRRRRIEEERKLAKDRVHFVTEVDVAYSGVGEGDSGQEEVTLLLRLPKSELKQLKVVPSEAHCDPWPVDSDKHGVVRVPVRPRPDVLSTVKLGFHFETSTFELSDVVVPDPW